LRLFGSTLFFFVVAIPAGAAHAAPWPARHPAVVPPSAHQLMDLSRWPDEPLSPQPVDGARFRAAVAHLCGLPQERTPSDEVLASAHEAEIDPFLLAAFMTVQSRCDAHLQRKGAYGLLAIEPALYHSDEAPPTPIAPAEWSPESLLAPRSNLSVGARLLRMWKDEHKAIDEVFGSVPHRHPVSHMFWGDHVISSGNEDLVLTARRRLIGTYEGRVDAPVPAAIGVDVVPPLEGTPRVAVSGPGDDRDGGARRHQGLDISASLGEPVRSIANGTVIFAGASLPSNSRRGPIPPKDIAKYARRRLGAGGIYVCVRHTPITDEGKGVVSCYMHLERYIVSQDDAVTAGQTIGFVGRTGVKVSPPHLHFEIRVNDRKKNPLTTFTSVLIPPQATISHVYAVKAQRDRLRAERARRSADARELKY
jgi:murein DD-endopeptidase MepM/ murein hydrolase activator NlpD